MSPVVGLVATAAGGLQGVRAGFVEPAVLRGWRVAVTLTPTAAGWLEHSGERGRIEQLTGLAVRDRPRRADEISSPHPHVDCFVVAPATANTVAKLALGIADNQALTVVGEALGDPRVPVVVFPRINAAHARHPAWSTHIDALRSAGVQLIGRDLWPLYEPRAAPPDRELPWAAILDRVAELLR